MSGRAWILALVAAAALLAAATTGAAAHATPAQLLARHAPLLVLHPEEDFVPVPVTGFLADSDLLVPASGGTWQATTVPLAQAGKTSRLDQRACRASDGPAAIDCYAGAQAAHVAVPTVYGAVFRRGERVALQYWLFYPLNAYSPTVPAGPFWQAHEGDWEAVTVLLGTRGRPELVGVSRHCSGVRRAWARTPRRGSRPVVHVALGSHAHYLAAGEAHLDRGCWPKEALAVYDAYKVDLRDHAADGRTVSPRVVRVTASAPSWMAFAGTWGEDQYVHFPDVDPLRYGAGPVGPAYHRLWREPFAEPLRWAAG